MVPDPPGREAGSVLMLLPAAVLVMLALAAIAVDGAVAYLGQRELANAAVAAANDAATLSLHETSFYREGEVATDAQRLEAIAEERVRAAVDGRRLRGLVVEAQAQPPATAGCSWTVVIRAWALVDRLFGAALPAGAGSTEVRARASASPRQAHQEC